MKRLLWIFMLFSIGVMPMVLAQTDFTCEEIIPPTDNLAFYVGLGNGYFEQGDYSKAIEIYTCALGVDASYVPAHVSRGFAYATQGNEAAALDDYNTAIELDGNFLAAYTNRGILYTRQGRFGLALNDFDLVLALAPDNAVAYNNRGIVLAAEGDYELAIADFEAALEIDPDFAQPHASLALVYTALAVESYANYRSIAGETAQLPAGEADDVLRSLSVERETGTFNTWLPLQTPAQ
jgi:tetratricopeptide (TPR) repeat protein